VRCINNTDACNTVLSTAVAIQSPNENNMRIMSDIIQKDVEGRKKGSTKSGAYFVKSVQGIACTCCTENMSYVAFTE
jgi:hypothetical protein